MDQSSSNSRIYTTAQTAQDPPIANLSADVGHSLLSERRRRPRRSAFADIDGKTTQDLRSGWRMHDLGMELDTKKPALGITYGGKRRVLTTRLDTEAFGHFFHSIAMAHPNLRLVPQRCQQRHRRVRFLIQELDLGQPIFPMGR